VVAGWQAGVVAATVQSTICEDIVRSAMRHDDCLTG
jgi:hypothetical protein